MVYICIRDHFGHPIYDDAHGFKVWHRDDIIESDFPLISCHWIIKPDGTNTAVDALKKSIKNDCKKIIALGGDATIPILDDMDIDHLQIAHDDASAAYMIHYLSVEAEKEAESESPEPTV